MIKSLEDLKKVLSRPEKTMTAAESVQAFRLFRQLETAETDPKKKARLTESVRRFRALTRMKSITRQSD